LDQNTLFLSKNARFFAKSARFFAVFAHKPGRIDASVHLTAYSRMTQPLIVPLNFASFGGFA